MGGSLRSSLAGCARLPIHIARALKKGFIFISLRIVYLKSFSNFYKFVQIFDFQGVIIKKNGAYCPYFPFLLSRIRFILTRFDANIATALCIVNALRP